jgi:hypothetical protein
MVEPGGWNGETINLCGVLATVKEVQERLSGVLGTGRGMMWLPRWFVLAMTPRHSHQMFLVSANE